MLLGWLGVVFVFLLGSAAVAAEAGHPLRAGMASALAWTTGSACVHGVLLLHRPERRRGRLRTGQVAGRPVTMLPNRRALLVALMAVWLGALVVGALAAAGLVRAGNDVAAWGLTAVTAGAASLVVEWLVGRVAVGYLALGPGGIHQRGRTFEAFLPWDGVHAVGGFVPGLPGFLMSGYGNAAFTFRRTSWWRIERLLPGPALPVDPMTSALPVDLPRRVVAFYVEHPEHRHELGTDAALARFAPGTD